MHIEIMKVLLLKAFSVWMSSEVPILGVCKVHIKTSKIRTFFEKLFFNVAIEITIAPKTYWLTITAPVRQITIGANLHLC